MVKQELNHGSRVLTINCTANGISFACCSESQMISMRFCSREAEQTKKSLLLRQPASPLPVRASYSQHPIPRVAVCDYSANRWNCHINQPYYDSAHEASWHQLVCWERRRQGGSSDAADGGRAARSDHEQIHRPKKVVISLQPLRNATRTSVWGLQIYTAFPYILRITYSLSHRPLTHSGKKKRLVGLWASPLFIGLSNTADFQF